MTRKISGHDGDLVVNDAVELDGDVTGGLVVEPGGSVVINGSLTGNTVSVGTTPADPAPDDLDLDDLDLDGHELDGHELDHHQLEGDLGSVISDIP
jgi:hypothetical protein